jgi:hypothetical protein
MSKKHGPRKRKELSDAGIEIRCPECGYDAALSSQKSKQPSLCPNCAHPRRRDETSALVKASVIPFLKTIKSENTPERIKWQATVDQFQAQLYGTEELGFMPGQLIQCTFPHDNPGNELPIWTRSTPWLSVSIRPGYAPHPKNKTKQVCIGYPYGVVPRHFFFYLAEQVEYTKNRIDMTDLQKRTISLGDSFGAFLRNIGMNPDNGSGKRSDRERCQNQIRRTVRAIFTFDDITDPASEEWHNMPVSLHGRFFWDHKQPGQGTLWDSYVILSESLYNAFKLSNVPHDKLAIRALKDSALHLDLYTWGLLRPEQIRHSKSGKLLLPWRYFMQQLGTSYKHVRQFRARVIKEFPVVQPFLGDTKINFLEEGIEVIPPARPVISQTRLFSVPSGT